MFIIFRLLNQFHVLFFRKNRPENSAAVNSPVGSGPEVILAPDDYIPPMTSSGWASITHSWWVIWWVIIIVAYDLCPGKLPQRVGRFQNRKLNSKLFLKMAFISRNLRNSKFNFLNSRKCLNFNLTEIILQNLGK